MLNCIIATTRPKARTNSPSTPASFMRRSTVSASVFGVERQIVLLRQVKQPDQIDRIAPEDVGAGDVDAVVVDGEVVGLAQGAPAARRAQARHHAAEHRRGLGLALLEAGAEDGGEVADMLGGEEIVLHEALDVL